MPKDTDISVTPYQSQVPMVNIPPQDLERAQPYPTQAGYGGKTAGALSFADATIKGITKGLQIKEEHKARTAQATIDAADKGVSQSFGSYQQVASEKGVDSPEGKAAYDAYLAQFNQAKEAKAKFVIPEKPQKGQKEDKNMPAAEKYSGWHQFFARNPHIIPEIALTSMQPQKPGLTTETQETKNKLQSQQNTLKIQGQTIDANTQKAVEEKDKYTQQKSAQAVEQAGGYDAVLKDPKAPPEMQQAARQMKYSILDKQTPEGKMKFDLQQKVLAGQPLTESEQHIAGALGVIPEPKLVKMTGKNGHEMEMAVDPVTGKPLPGSKPLDLGPPQWAQEFYGERAAKRNDVTKAVRGNPASFGIQLTGDKKTDDARIDAAVSMTVAAHEEGIKATQGMTGLPAGEISRNNAILKDAYGDIEKQIPAKGTADFQWAGGQKVPLDRSQMGGVLGQFFSDPQETPGNYAFRNEPKIQDGKPWQAAERDRQFAYNLVKNRMMAQKGKNAVSAEQADAILQNTAVGKPITADNVPSGTPDETKPRPKPESSWSKSYDAVKGAVNKGVNEVKSWGSSIPQPAQAAASGGKLYMVPGHDQPVQLTDEEAQKAKAANIQLSPVPEELLQQQ